MKSTSTRKNNQSKRYFQCPLCGWYYTIQRQVLDPYPQRAENVLGKPKEQMSWNSNSKYHSKVINKGFAENKICNN